jgi:hypothetical protein
MTKIYTKPEDLVKGVVVQRIDNDNSINIVKEVDWIDGQVVYETPSGQERRMPVLKFCRKYKLKSKA